MSLHYYMTIHHLDRPSSDRQILHKYFRKRAENALWTMTMSLTKAQSSISSGALLWRHCTTSSTSEKKHSLINDIDIFCRMQKKIQTSELGVTWSWSKSPPEKQPVLPARSRPCSFAEALLIFPRYVFLFVFLFFIFLFCIFFLVLVFILFIF